MNIQQKLESLKNYYEVTRAVGHTTLLKQGTLNYDREKLILVYKKEEYDEIFKCKLSELISWNNLNGLLGHKKPLAIDNSAMWLLLKESLEYIDELEEDRAKLIEIIKIIKK